MSEVQTIPGAVPPQGGNPVPELAGDVNEQPTTGANPDATPDRQWGAPVDLQVPYQTPTKIDLPAHGDDVVGASCIHGTATFADGVLTYTPDDGYWGFDELDVRGLDPDGRGTQYFSIEIPEPSDDDRVASDKVLADHKETQRQASVKAAAGNFTPEQWSQLTSWVRREITYSRDGVDQPAREKLNP